MPRNWPYLKDGQHEIKWTVVTPPATEAVTLADLKAQLKIEHNEEDAKLQSYLTAAIELVERTTGTVLIDQLIAVHFDEFPSGETSCLEIPVNPVTSVSQVTYTDTAGNSATWTDYLADLYGFRAKLIPAYNTFYPSARGIPNAVEIRVQAGYADADSVPKRYKQAVLLIASDWYFNAEDSSTLTLKTIPHSASMLLGIDRNVIL